MIAHGVGEYQRGHPIRSQRGVLSVEIEYSGTSCTSPRHSRLSKVFRVGEQAVYLWDRDKVELLHERCYQLRLAEERRKREEKTND